MGRGGGPGRRARCAGALASPARHGLRSQGCACPSRRAPAFSRNVRFVQGDVAGHGGAALGASLLLGGGHRGGGQEVVVQPSPAEGIERHRAELRVLEEDALLAAVRAISALADSGSPRGRRKSPGRTRAVCSPRLRSSGSGAGSGPWCRSSSGSRGGTCTRACSRFVMVPSGLLGPLPLPRCWSRWPAIPALALVSGRCGS